MRNTRKRLPCERLRSDAVAFIWATRRVVAHSEVIVAQDLPVPRSCTATGRVHQTAARGNLESGARDARPLWRNGALGDAAHARDRHPHGAGRGAWKDTRPGDVRTAVDSDRRGGDGRSGGTAVGALYRDPVVWREGARCDGGDRRGAGVDGDGDCGGVPAGAPRIAGQSAVSAPLRVKLPRNGPAKWHRTHPRRWRARAWRPDRHRRVNGALGEADLLHGRTSAAPNGEKDIRLHGWIAWGIRVWRTRERPGHMKI